MPITLKMKVVMEQEPYLAWTFIIKLFEDLHVINSSPVFLRVDRNKQRSRWCFALLAPLLPHLPHLSSLQPSCLSTGDTRRSIVEIKILVLHPFCLINFQLPSSLVCKCYCVCWVLTTHLYGWGQSKWVVVGDGYIYDHVVMATINNLTVLMVVPF